ncbi:MAG: aldo/keto reductase [Candidatus Eisenbacteria bacterium]
MGSALPAGAGLARADEGGGAAKETPKTKRFRTLGRTGFEVGDISIGCGGVKEANVIRYAYDHGVNYFDTAEGYGNGGSETAIGEAMPHLDRKKIFITTKLPLNEDETEQTIRERFAKCLERLKTPYVDALFIHGVSRLDEVTSEAFHGAAAKLKADGKVRHLGISSHGPRGDEGDSMEKVLVAAAEDGRFDLMLLSYNWLNKDEAERVLAACKAKNIGTTAMKTMPGYIELKPYDPDNPNEEYEEFIESQVEQGNTRESAIERIDRWVERESAKIADFRPYLDRYGIKTDDELRAKSVQWVLGNTDMHTVCVSMNDFDTIDEVVPLSGTELTRADSEFLRGWEYAYGGLYCRHGCTACLSNCPARVPVSTIMRYSYYFARQGREKHGMLKYARLGARNAAPCLGCAAPCGGACPHGVDIQSNLVRAHGLLTV